MTARARAVVVIDPQRGVLSGVGTWDADAVVAPTVDLVARARRRGTPVVWVQHDSDELPAEFAGGAVIPARMKIDVTNAYVRWGLIHPDVSGTTARAVDLEL